MMRSRSFEALVKAFRQDPDTFFDTEDIAILAGGAVRDLWAAKACALHYHRARDPSRALPWARLVAEREPGGESAMNLVVVLRSLCRHAEALAALKANATIVDPIRFHDMMCSLHGYLGQIDKARCHGDESLRLKDASAPTAPPLRPQLHRFDAEKAARNVIAFSVWGGDPRYLTGAVNNAVVARYLYPGWTARFYVDASTPERFRDVLRQNGAQVLMVQDLPASRFGLFWRFLVEDDEQVDFYLVRDADSVLNIKERSAVSAWLRSGRAFHLMRDNIQHSELILAGMWGAHRGNIGRMRERVLAFDALLSGIGNYVHRDQHFLRREVWPLVRQDVLVHDRHFSFGSAVPFDPDYELPSCRHIGQDDWVYTRSRAASAPSATTSAGRPVGGTHGGSKQPTAEPAAGSAGSAAEKPP